MIRKLRRALYNAMLARGYQIVRVSSIKKPVDWVSLRRSSIFTKEKIDLLLDVGGALGHYTGKAREDGYAGAVISFEPLEDFYAKISARAASDPNWTVRRCAVGDRDGEIEINVSGHPTSSSVLPIAAAHVDACPDSGYVSVQKVPLVRLDSLLGKDVDPTRRVYLKADVQGFEMHVLAGATDLLKQVRAVELELSTVTLYDGGCRYDEVINRMESLGFGLVSFEDTMREPGTGLLLQLDAIFVRRATAVPTQAQGRSELGRP